MQIVRHKPDSIVVGLTRVAETLSGLDALEPGLSGHDRDRAARFRFPEDRARLILGRRLLAVLLRDELGLTAQPLELALTEKGRPFLPDRTDVAFSISHAGDVVAVALTLGAQVGLDVESLDRRVELDSLAERIFSTADLVRFRAVPDAEKTRAFFRAWTGKEAVLKARGVGLFGGVEEISAPLDGAAETIRAGLDEAWHIQPLIVPEGYVGAVACDDPRRAIRARDFTLTELAAA
jgi:4'-phosphopantetheinyl transferase